MKNRKPKPAVYKLSEVQRNIARDGRRVGSRSAPSCNETCGCGLESVFHVRIQWFIFFVTASIRLYYVLQKDSWWILHPDEIFQSLEVAFSEQYGYGFRFYEYLPPPTNASSVEEQEWKFGMFSLRSFLLPRFYMLFFALSDFCGVQGNPYLISRMAHVVVTSSLPVAVYYFVRRLYPCRLTSVLASLFTAFSLPLSVIGTHTLVNSVLSPFMVFSITPMAGFFLDNRYFLTPALLKSYQERKGNETLAREQKNDSNVDSDSPNDKSDISPKEASPKPAVGKSNSSPRSVLETSNTSPKVALGKSSTSPKSMLETSNTTPSAAAGTHETPAKADVRTSRRPKEAFDICCFILCGFVLGLTTYIRIDTLMFTGSIILTISVIFFQVELFLGFLMRFFCAGLGFVIAVLLGGYEDLYRYGVMFISPLQWMAFNMRANLSSVLFGVQSSAIYLQHVVYPDIFTFLFNICIVIGVTNFMFRASNRRTENIEKIVTIALICSGSSQFLAYCCVEHKETRFLHNVIVIMLIISAKGFHSILVYLHQRLLKRDQLKVMLFFLLGSYILNTYSVFPSPSSSVDNLWAYKSITESNDVNKCLYYVSNQQNVTGVFVDSSIYLTSGYTILKHDVPLLILIHNEYHEYRDRGFLLESYHKYRMSPGLRIINRFTDYAHKTNNHYLKKFLLERTEYNYIVCSKANFKSFTEYQFEVVFTTDIFVVLRRDINEEERKKIASLSRAMSVGENATLLEYEGSWLFTAAVYKKAVQRLEKCVQTENSRWRPYQILGMSYVKMKKWEKAKDVERRCFQKYGENTCRKPQTRIVLNEEYNQINGLYL